MFNKVSYIFICYILSNYAIASPIIGINIRPANTGEFPSIVAIKFINNATTLPEDSRICTGTLISPLHVLTAAHCLEEVAINSVEIIIGSIDIRSGRKHYPYWWVDYNRWKNCSDEIRKIRMNDVAVIKMTENSHPSVKVAELSVVPDVYLSGLTAKAAGWGITNDGKNPQFLQTVELTILTNDECGKRVGMADKFRSNFPAELLCSVGNPHAVLVVGDSGCPIFIDDVIVAVHKSSAPYPHLLDHPNKVNIHNSVYAFRNFILDIMNGGDVWL